MSFLKRKNNAETADKVAKTTPNKEKVVSPKEATFDFVKASKEFEKSRINDVLKSRDVAWRVAIGACALAICCVIAIVFITPLKEVKPYVIRVDNNTGVTDIVTMLDGTTPVGYSEQMSKYFAALYVSQLEGYDWYTISKQVEHVMMFSDAAMQNRINNKFTLPDAPHKIYKDEKRVEIQINNISIIDEKGLMQVRYTARIMPTNGGSYNPEKGTMTGVEEKKYIATIGYEYVNVPKLDSIRLVNPFGFTVKSYRVDQDGI